MNLLQAIDKLAQIEGDVTFDSGIALAPTTIARVYPLTPKTGKFAVDLPCFMNSWSLTDVSRYVNSQRKSRYVLRAQCLVGKVEGDTSLNARVATAIHDAFITALDAELGFGVGVTFLRETRGETDTLAVLEWNGLGYVGLSYEFELDLFSVSTFAIGVPA